MVIILSVVFDDIAIDGLQSATNRMFDDHFYDFLIEWLVMLGIGKQTYGKIFIKMEIDIACNWPCHILLQSNLQSSKSTVFHSGAYEGRGVNKSIEQNDEVDKWIQFFIKTRFFGLQCSQSQLINLQ